MVALAVKLLISRENLSCCNLYPLIDPSPCVSLSRESFYSLRRPCLGPAPACVQFLVGTRTGEKFGVRPDKHWMVWDDHGSSSVSNAPEHAAEDLTCLYYCGNILLTFVAVHHEPYIPFSKADSSHNRSQPILDFWLFDPWCRTLLLSY